MYRLFLLGTFDSQLLVSKTAPKENPDKKDMFTKFSLDIVKSLCYTLPQKRGVLSTTMYHKTLSYYATLLYRNFSAFTSDRLQQFGLNYGLLFFIVYIGKKPNCTPSELTKELALDWGHSQRCVNRLVEDGFITKEKSGRHYLLNLTERGQEAFEAAHRVFFDWDSTFMTNLNAKEKEQLLTLLEKAAQEVPHHVRNDQ
mgnify:CR=1 FL=1